MHGTVTTLLGPLVDALLAFAGGLPATPLQSGPLSGVGPLGQLLIAVVVLAVVVAVGRVVLNVAWRILTVVGLVIAVLFVASALGLF